MEEQSLKYEEVLKNKESTVCFRVSSLLRYREMNLFLNMLIFIFWIAKLEKQRKEILPILDEKEMIGTLRK